MYSPKIREELIPKIYRIAKAKGVKMTAWVNEVLEKAVKETDVCDKLKLSEKEAVYEQNQDKAGRDLD